MNTTNINEPIEQKGKQKGTLFVADLEMRDYFAAKAMAALMSRNDRSIATTREFIGETAYEYADLMLKAREQ